DSPIADGKLADGAFGRSARNPGRVLGPLAAAFAVASGLAAAPRLHPGWPSSALHDRPFAGGDGALRTSSGARSFEGGPHRGAERPHGKSDRQRAMVRTSRGAGDGSGCAFVDCSRRGGAFYS